MDGSPARHEGAEESTKRERRERHGANHPDPRGHLEWERTKRQKCDDLPRHVVVDERVGHLRAEGDRGGDITIRIPRIDAGKDGRRSGPDPREIVEVDHLEPTPEGADENDERDADKNRGEVGKVGAALGGHVGGRDATAWLVVPTVGIVSSFRRRRPPPVPFWKPARPDRSWCRCGQSGRREAWRPQMWCLDQRRP